MQSPIWVFTSATGRGAQEPIRTYVSQMDPTIEQLVEALRPSDSSASARSICNKFRLAVKDFSDLDQAAMLWLAYRQSPLALAGHKHTDNQAYTCLRKDEIAGLSQLGLPAVEVLVPEPVKPPAPNPDPVAPHA